MNRGGRVDVRKAAGVVVRALKLDVPLPGSGPLTKDEAKRLADALDAFTPDAIKAGVMETILALASDVLFLALHEQRTTAGERPKLVIGRAKASDAALRIFDAAIARAEARARAKDPKFRVSKRTPDGVSRRALRRRLADLVNAVYGYGAKQPRKVVVYVLFLLGGTRGLAAVVEDEPRDDDTAVTYTTRATKRIEDMTRDRKRPNASRR